MRNNAQLSSVVQLDEYRDRTNKRERLLRQEAVRNACREYLKEPVENGAIAVVSVALFPGEGIRKFVCEVHPEDADALVSALIQVAVRIQRWADGLDDDGFVAEPSRPRDKVY